MKISYLVIPVCGCLLANSYVCYRFACTIRVVDSYRSDVEALGLAVYAYTTNLESRISVSSSSLRSHDVFRFNSSTGIVASIPYRYAVVRGVCGLTSGGSSWYPVGSLMPYGVLSSCDFDFAFFEDGSCYTLNRDSTRGIHE